MPRTGKLDLELVTRLAGLVEDYQLLELIEVIEAVQLAGKGYGVVEITFSNSSVTDIAGKFTRKPRPNQSGLLSPQTLKKP